MKTFANCVNFLGYGLFLVWLVGGCADAPKMEPMQDIADDVRWCAEERPAHVIISDALPVKCAEEAQKMVLWWYGQGVQYLTFAVVPDEDITASAPIPLFIQITADLPEDVNASGDTRIHRITSECIDSAEIRIDPYYCGKGNTIAHELGHALGLQHVKDKDNLMFPGSLPGGFFLAREQQEHVR